MNRLIPIAPICAALLVVACGASDPTDEVKDVQFYLDNEDARKEMKTICDNNPGELLATPNCINMYEAERKAMYEAIRRSTNQSQ